ncbi:hypothetical protein [Nocardia niwae]|uniref:hypothetical protein n=1 Tax=Nocardia niwae TaxID=626084 RepID=UPI0033C2E123
MPNNDLAVNLEVVARMPWLLAEEESIWLITGTYGHDLGSFTNCLAMVAPFDTTDGHRLFTLIHPNLQPCPGSPMQYIAPNQISHARRMVLVYADDPRTAYRVDDQDLLDRAPL